MATAIGNRLVAVIFFLLLCGCQMFGVKSWGFGTSSPGNAIKEELVPSLGLLDAAVAGHSKLILNLVEIDGINAKNEKGETALHLAAANDHVNVVVELLGKAGADVNAVDDRGNTPLHHAARGGHRDMITVLIHFGANLDLKTKSGFTARQYIEQASQLRDSL